MPSSRPVDPSVVAEIRAFNRFFTRRIGVLRPGLLDSPFSLSEARVLVEIAERDAPSARQIAADLGLDAGYLSRTLKGFERRGLIRRRQSTTDRRRLLLEVTERGRRVFNDLNRRAIEDVERLVSHLSVADRRRLVRAMTAVRRLLGDPASPVRPGRRSS
ncbi:MAG: MarR family winged helix-turn-helix transcriptional regulator [Betaproteobacteria bacterium]